LQKLEGFAGMSASQVLEVTTEVLSIENRRIGRRLIGK
jgi:hypothetical protein